MTTHSLIHFDILYQDEHLIAINKPEGWLVHRSWLACDEKFFILQTLRNQIGQHVFPVHRLDRPTSGVLLFALSSEIAHKTALQFEAGAIEKTYQAIVRGFILNAGEIDYPLKLEMDKIANKFTYQSDSKEEKIQQAHTFYRPLAHFELPIASDRHPTCRYSFIELTPKTGRKHQLRRHLKHIFHPIIGDSKYGDLKQNRIFCEHFEYKRLFLHALSLKFIHPVLSKSIYIEAPLPEAWQAILTEFQFLNKRSF